MEFGLTGSAGAADAVKAHSAEMTEKNRMVSSFFKDCKQSDELFLGNLYWVIVYEERNVSTRDRVHAFIFTVPHVQVGTHPDQIFFTRGVHMPEYAGE